MEYSFELHKYQSNMTKITVIDKDENTIGTLQRFSNNKMSESILRHFSSTFVSNVRAISLETDDDYTIQLKNQAKAFISTAEWSIEKNNEVIGTIREKGVGKTLFINLMGQEYLVKSEIGSIREIKLFKIDTNEEILMGKGKRNLNLAKPKMTVDLTKEELPPILASAFCFLLNNQGK